MIKFKSFCKISVRNAGQVPEMSVIPKFLYCSAGKLIGLCHGDVRMHVVELLSIVHSFNSHLKIFLQPSPIKTQCFQLVPQQEDDEPKVA